MDKQHQPQTSAVRAKLNISCGCGYKPRNFEEATQHAANTSHLLNISGQLGTLERLNDKVRLLHG